MILALPIAELQQNEDYNSLRVILQFSDKAQETYSLRLMLVAC